MFYIGYVPKDIAFNLSIILSYPNVFEYSNIKYSTQEKASFIEVDLML
jgi:hypothetical protein